MMIVNGPRTLTLMPHQIIQVLEALADKPYRTAAPLINIIQQQMAEQEGMEAGEKLKAAASGAPE